jgi:hypothetical protein
MIRIAEPPMTVAEECALRHNCRYGLGGLRMKHVPTGREFTCHGSVWGPDDRLFVYDPSRVRLPASECLLLQRWPVTCCRPRRSKTPDGR